MPRNINSNQNESTQSHLVLLAIDNCRMTRTVVQKIIRLNKQIIKNLEVLFEFRIVEKLARPISIESKNKMIGQYKQILAQVHGKMNSIEKDKDLSTLVNEKQSHNLQKIKKKLQAIMHVKLALFGIRKKYTEVLIQSSLIHYQKITSIYSINQPLVMIDVDKWLTVCVQKLQKNANVSKQTCC